jgi:hypothetical protein
MEDKKPIDLAASRICLQVFLLVLLAVTAFGCASSGCS